VAIETLNEGRIGIGAQMVGLSLGALDHAVAYVQERKQFRKSTGEFQAVQFQLAQAATELEMARVGVYNAARLRDAGCTKDSPIEKLYQDAKIRQIYEGTSNMQLQTTAKQILHA
jgi:alkylation response protein AidB-like acyl-CoA dehydrogenase